VKLLGLAGAKGSGKDASFGFLREWAFGRGVVAVRRGFADKLKLSAARIFIPEIGQEDAIRLCDGIKNAPDYHIGIMEMSSEGETNDIMILQSVTGRQFLQNYGTEGHRDVFGDDFWVDALLPINRLLRIEGTSEQDRAQDFWYNFLANDDPTQFADIAVITDVRFANEAKRIKDNGGMVWEVIRGDEQIADKHLSESREYAPFVDYIVRNDEGLAELNILVAQMTDSILLKP